MGIWVRSQDKMQLHLMQSIMINRIKLSIWGLTSSGIQYDLGLYETEERALEVLNDIQELIECKNAETIMKNTNFYQMPEK